MEESSAETSDHKEDHISIGDPRSYIKALDRHFSDEEETEKHSQLSSARVVSGIEVAFPCRSGNQVLDFVSCDP